MAPKPACPACIARTSPAVIRRDPARSGAPPLRSGTACTAHRIPRRAARRRPSAPPPRRAGRPGSVLEAQRHSPDVSVARALSQRDANDWLPPAWPLPSPLTLLAGAAGEPPTAGDPAARHQHHPLVPLPAEPRSGGVARLSRRCGHGADLKRRRLHLRPPAGAARLCWTQPDARDRGGGPAAAARPGRGRGAVPVDWHLETAPSDQASLLCDLALAGAEALRRFDPAMTVPEVLNEPVFAGDPAAWASLQHRALR